MEINAKQIGVAPCDPKTLNRWMAFRCTPKPDGSVDKEPCSVRDGYVRADISNPDTWASYSETIAAIENPPDDCHYELGFVIDPTISLVCYDIDKARATGAEWPQWVRDEVARYRTFSEDSVSGCGKHIWLWGTIDLGKDVEKNDGCELFVRKMVAVSPEFAEHWQETRVAEAGELEELRRRIVAGEIRNAGKIRAATSNGGLTLEQLEAGESPEGDRSAGDHAYVKELIRAGLPDEAIDARFRESQRMREKWEREDYRANTFARAHKDVAQETAVKKNDAPKVLEFAFPAEPYSNDEFVIEPLVENSDGWFPLGDVSLVAGPSGAGKTRLMWDILQRQKRGEKVFGHDTKPRPYLVLMADRGRRDNERTLKSMGIDPTREAVGFLPLCNGFEAAQAMVREIEKVKPLPKLVFAEGLDFLVRNAGDVEYVPAFLHYLGEIADHYNLAIIGSVGSPKLKVGEGYLAKRDSVFGSMAWARLSSTILVLQYFEGNDMDDRRLLSVLPRGAKPESVNLIFVGGKLFPDMSAGVREAAEEEIWLREQGGVPFQQSHVTDGLRCGKSRASDLIGEWLKDGKITRERVKPKRGKWFYQYTVVPETKADLAAAD